MTTKEILDYLGPIERQIIPFLKLNELNKISKESGLDLVTVLRALELLENKGLVKLNIKKKRIIDLGNNGVLYLKNGLPERRLLTLLESKKNMQLEEAEKLSNLSEKEFKVSLGVLKRKSMIELKNKKISIIALKEELSKRSIEEKFLEALPKESGSLTKEELTALKNLENRKDIIETSDKNIVSFELTDTGKEIIDLDIKSDLIEELTPEIIQKGTKNKRFRKYDIKAPVPKIYGGKQHFVNQAIEKAKKIWLELGFKEMTGSKTVSSFWNFDALFTAQDHPVRDMQDTFFLKDIKSSLPDKKLVQEVKKAHEQGLGGSKGWQYDWDTETAKKTILRTHTTCLSAKTLYSLKKQDLPAKFFSIGKCFRNETIDWNHSFEFNQSEGIVIDENANFRHLIAYLKEFANKMGYDKFRIQPAYFPYTEPSVEGAVWNQEKKEWVEVIAAGIFRPEVTIPLLGKAIPVLAWGPGFDRLMMKAQKIKDLRELYENDIKKLRDKKFV